MEKRKKKVLLTGIALLSAFGVFAQGNGNVGIQEATQMVTGYPAIKLIYAIGAVVTLIRGVKVYNKFSSGDPRHIEDGCKLVRCMYLLNRCSYHSEFILPLIRCLMSNYNINKGIGRTVEFKGLKARYLFIFAGGLLGVLILVMIMYMLCSSGRAVHRSSLGKHSH